ncbi:MAG: gluconolactonase [Actinomycetota bacterium]
MSFGEAINWRTIATGLQFPEGPVAMSDGSVLVVEIRRGCITRVSPDGTLTRIADTGGGPNGAAIGPDGALYVCNNGGFEWADYGELMVPGHQPHDYFGGRIQRVDLATGEVSDLYTECNGNPLRGPNDIVFDRAGGFWFTDLGKGRARDLDRGGVYYAKADGSSIIEAAYPADQPNGIGLSPDGTMLYAAESPTGRIWAWDVAAPGELRGANPLGPGGARLLYTPTGQQFFDSLAVDEDGNICVGTIPTGAISVIGPDGSARASISIPDYDPFVTNICFGGPDRRTAFVTASGTGRLLAADWPTAGTPLAYES